MNPLETAHINNDDDEEDDEIFKSEDEMKRSLSRFCYGDLCVIGTIWIRTLKFLLVGANMSLIPVVKAAKPPDCPKRPPPMKSKDLPIYKSPHYEYKDHIAQKSRCPEANDKLFHKFLLPHVTCYRRSIQRQACDARCSIGKTYNDIYCSINTSAKDFKTFMRSRENLQLRQTVLATTTATGYFIGSGRGIPRRIFFAGLGALAGGSLCFPKETDEAFRNFLYHSAKTLIAAYNFYCNKSFALKERIPCKDDMPTPSKPREQQCPEKK
ncbi:uncharacterized protein LOC113510342 [Galleria mellonella]|uniref:Uncharacterized protein LOC113510342 n=1 Tax=Galleria mellonella TaxID=7137 RepID=A0A6J1WA30_GALME|nr:uncharacterized protein LOC113510342 [Galleria mellonella]